MTVSCRRLLTVLLALTAPQVAYASDNLAGKWEGMFHCYGVNFFFDMDIRAESDNTISARLEAEPKLMGRKGINWQPESVNTDLQGTFIPELALFKLTSTSASNNQWFDFDGVVDPASGQMSAHVKSRFYGSCSYLLGARKNPNKDIKPVVKNAKYTPARTSSSGLTPRQCDAEIQDWLNQLDSFSERISRDKVKYAALTLFQDDYFQPFFGASLEDVSKSRLAKLNYQIQAGCPHAIQSQNARSVFPQIRAVLDNNVGLSRAEVFMHPVTKRVVQSWSNWARQAIHQQTGLSDEQLEFFTTTADDASQILWPTDTVDYQAEVVVAKQRNRTSQFLAEVRGQIESGFESIQQFSQLSAMAANHSSKGISSDGLQQAEQLIGEAINQHVLSITQTFVADQSGLKGLNNLRPVEDNPAYSQFVGYLSQENKRQANEILSTHRRNLISEISANESKDYSQKNYGADGNLSMLEALVDYENNLDRKYGKLLEENDFAEFNALRSEHRGALFSKYRDQIVNLINSSQELDQMQTIINRYVSPKDSFRFAMLERVAAIRYKEVRSEQSDYCDSLTELARSTMKLRVNGQPKSLALALVKGLDNASANVVEFVYGQDFGDSKEEEKRFIELTGAENLEDLAASKVALGCLKM